MRRRLPLFLLLATSLVGAASLAQGCSAGTEGTGTGPGAGPGGTGGDGTGGAGPGGPGSTTGGGNIFVTSGGGEGGDGGSIPINPCGTECGPEELCDGIHKGIDDDCDGQVDENCPCGVGEASACFKGDPSYRDTPGCLDGTMYCSELGTWGPCTGGKHATEMCFQGDPNACQPISAVPFQTVDLFTGTGTFDDDATSETFTVECPTGVSPCPAVVGGSNFQPLQSGEYTVTYTKTGPNGQETCTFPLRVGARGLRVEMQWNWGNDGGRDLDLHLHQPNSLAGWAPTGSAPQANVNANCAYHNCKFSQITSSFSAGDVPNWFPASAPFGDPVRWYEDTANPQANTCYYAPRGVGEDWEQYGQGCHNPRLDLDNISCSPSITDPNSFSFCAPENVNVDFPPQNQWMRIGVYGFSSSQPEPQRPTIKVYCDGALAAELGPVGYNAPVAVPANQMWVVADVLFQDDGCVNRCVVQPIYGDPATKSPYFMTSSQAQASVGPAYFPIPDPNDP